MGWFNASIYLICGAFRLPRFNCLAAHAGTGGGKDFQGIPIPAEAGLVATSVTPEQPGAIQNRAREGETATNDDERQQVSEFVHRAPLLIAK